MNGVNRVYFHNSFDRTVAILTLAVATFTAYYAYLSYNLDRDEYDQPNLVLRLYKTEGNNEAYYDSLDVDLSTVTWVNGYIEYSLPIRLQNNTVKDADKITVWVGVQKSDDVIFQVPPGQCGWNSHDRRGGKWIARDCTPLPPSAGYSLNCVKLRIKQGTKQAKIDWEILASRMVPKSGTLVLRF